MKPPVHMQAHDGQCLCHHAHGAHGRMGPVSPSALAIYSTQHPYMVWNSTSRRMLCALFSTQPFTADQQGQFMCSIHASMLPACIIHRTWNSGQADDWSDATHFCIQLYSGAVATSMWTEAKGMFQSIILSSGTLMSGRRVPCYAMGHAMVPIGIWLLPTRP
jgi:hypothetical protein